MIGIRPSQRPENPGTILHPLLFILPKGHQQVTIAKLAVRFLLQCIVICLFSNIIPIFVMCSIASLQDAVFHHVLGGTLQVPSPALPPPELDEGRHPIEVLSQLRRLVVPGERVVVVVPSFAPGEN